MRDDEMFAYEQEAYQRRRQHRTRSQRRRRKHRLIFLIFVLAALVTALVLILTVRGTQEAQVTGKLEIPAAPTETPAQEPETPEAGQVSEASYEIEAAEPVTFSDPSPVEILAKTVYGEAGICSTTEQAAVVWCICNRVDAGYGDLIAVATAPGQFNGYDSDNPVTPEIECLVQDVLIRWRMEESCIGGVGRVLPKDYLWFSGDGTHNYFRNEYQGGTRWNWSLENPYEEDRP